MIYKARDITEAHIISGLLKSNEIEAYVGGHYLQGGVGDLAALDFATISVADKDTESALSIIADYDKNNNTNAIKHRVKSIFTVPLIILALSVIMILLLALSYSDYR